MKKIILFDHQTVVLMCQLITSRKRCGRTGRTCCTTAKKTNIHGIELWPVRLSANTSTETRCEEIFLHDLSAAQGDLIIMRQTSTQTSLQLKLASYWAVTAGFHHLWASDVLSNKGLKVCFFFARLLNLFWKFQNSLSCGGCFKSLILLLSSPT